MSGSWIVAGAALGVFLIAAGGGVWVARRTKRRRQRNSIYWKSAFLAVCGVTFAVYAFWIDSAQRRTTLHEVILDGTAADELTKGEVIRRVTFQIEHPNVEHDLLIGPMHRTPTLQRADHTVRIAATLASEDGDPLLSDEFTFDARFKDTAWHAAYLSFTPQTDGPHTLTLRLLTPGIPAVHVRIADPLKTDGQRAPGY